MIIILCFVYGIQFHETFLAGGDGRRHHGRSSRSCWWSWFLWLFVLASAFKGIQNIEFHNRIFSGWNGGWLLLRCHGCTRTGRVETKDTFHQRRVSSCIRFRAVRASSRRGGLPFKVLVLGRGGIAELEVKSGCGAFATVVTDNTIVAFFSSRNSRGTILNDLGVKCQTIPRTFAAGGIGCHVQSHHSLQSWVAESIVTALAVWSCVHASTAKGIHWIMPSSCGTFVLIELDKGLSFSVDLLLRWFAAVRDLGHGAKGAAATRIY